MQRFSNAIPWAKSNLSCLSLLKHPSRLLLTIINSYYDSLSSVYKTIGNKENLH
jgi:hypothetical protein